MTNNLDTVEPDEDEQKIKYLACNKCGRFPDEAIAKRLRRIVRQVGLEKAVPQTDQGLYDCMFSVLGMIARKLESK
jgi:DNA polymerase III delta prime subunit